jgi:CheY-like chemotaxis protein
MAAVLIVDDDNAFRSVISTLFESDGGFDACVAAGNGAEALDRVKEVSPNLAVVDLSIPGMNGLQLAQELRAIAPKLPIFLLTADCDAHTEKEALAIGVTAVFSKFDDLATLVDNARAACGLE